MSSNVFDLSLDGEGGASPAPEPSYEPPTYLPSSVPNQSTAPAADKDVPQPPAPPVPPAPPPAAEFLPTAVQPQKVEVLSTPSVSDAVSQALLNAPPPQLATQDAPAPPVSSTPAAPAASTPPPPPAAPGEKAPEAKAPEAKAASHAATDSYRPVSEPVNLKPAFVDAPVASEPVEAPTSVSPAEPAPPATPAAQPKTEGPPMSATAAPSPPAGSPGDESRVRVATRPEPESRP
jgi:hypothetical protein